ncbi:MAG: MCP four helix bundle domain-containing protein [Aquabacterium sp.]
MTLPEKFAFRNWSVSSKLRLGFGITIGLIGLISAISFFAFHKAQSAQMAYDLALTSSKNAQHLGQLLTIDLTQSQAIAKSAGMPEVNDFFQPQIKRNDSEFQVLINSFKGAEHDRVRSAAQAIEESREAYKAARHTVLRMVETGQTIEATQKESEWLTPSAAKLSKDTEALIDESINLAVKAQQDMTKTVTIAKWTIGVLAVGAAFMGILFATAIGRAIAKPTVTAMRVSESIADGQLHREVPSPQSSDEFGRLLKSMARMRHKLVELTEEVKFQSIAVAQTSNEMAEGSEQLSLNTQIHAATLSDSTVALKSISEEIASSQIQTREASQLTSSAKSAALKGAESMDQTITQMQAIKDSSKRVDLPPHSRTS